jgi:prepilin-type N-terminal cleavage/methylation domain-containing protein
MTILAQFFRRNRGFTLIELLVVVGIVGLLMALVIPAFTGIGRGQSMRSSVAQLRTTIGLARQWAITRNENTYVIFPDDVKVYNPPSQVSMALRSYAVWGDKSGYISEWRYLPPGLYFDSQETNTINLLNTSSTNTSDRIFNVAFPSNNSPLQAMRCIAYVPNGRLNQRGATSLGVFVREGWVEVNTNTGRATGSGLGPIQRTNALYRLFVECRPLTGQVRVRE